MSINAVQFGNLFNTQAFKGVQASPAVKRQTGAQISATQQTSGNPFAAAVNNSNMFAGNTYGVNANIGIGDVSYTSAQAGKAAGIGRTLAFA